MEKSARKYKVKFTVEETEDHRLNVKVTYEVEVESGDTVYDIVSRIATADDDVNELAWQVLQDNHIEDCANLRPGTVLTITVPRVISDK